MRSVNACWSRDAVRWMHENEAEGLSTLCFTSSRGIAILAGLEWVEEGLYVAARSNRKTGTSTLAVKMALNTSSPPSFKILNVLLASCCNYHQFDP